MKNSVSGQKKSAQWTVFSSKTRRILFESAVAVYFHKHRCTVGMACAQAVAIRSAPYVARRHADVPRDLPLRMAMNEWDRDEASELVRA